MSDEILPLVNYSLSATWYPESTESKEQILFENLQIIQPYSDFTSSIYDHPNPCEVVHKKPLYVTPSELNFAKAYIDWIMKRQGAKHMDFRTKVGFFERVLLLKFQLDLPLVAKFMDPDYWLKNQIVIPTYYVDPETEQWMCFRFNSLILTNYAISINTDHTNAIKCDVVGINPDVIFLDKIPLDTSVFDNWISKHVEIHSYPDDIGLISQKIIFSANITQSTNVAFNSYKEPLQTKEIWYMYIPNPDGSFTRLNGYINLSDYVLDFDTYNWVLVQSQPQFNVTLEIFDPNHKLSRICATKFQVVFRNSHGDVLGQIHLYATETSFEMFRAQISGFGEFIPGDI